MCDRLVVDPVDDLLHGPRARGAFLLQALLDPPFALEVRDEAPVTLVVVTAGRAEVVPAAAPPRPVGAGEIAVLRGPAPYRVVDAPATPTQVVVHPGQRCTTPDGRDLHDAMTLGVRTWGTSADAATRMLVGTYAGSAGRLVAALPPLAVVDAAGAPAAALLASEIVRDEPGQEVVLDRLLDLLLVSVLRAWFADADHAPPLYRAYGDPVVGRALRLIDREPAHAWTVASLADAAGVSRAAFARRFTAAVGRSPIAHLTDRRLDLASDMLRDTDATLDAVARRVGYGSPFALSAAFRRVRAHRPRDLRRGHHPPSG